MIKNKLSKVQWLTIAELAELWSPELGLPVSTIKRELQFGLYKREQGLEMIKLLDERPPDEDVPPEEKLIQKEFIEQFCEESEVLWALPKFWFEGFEQEPVRRQGRPSLKEPIVERFNELAAAGLLEKTITAQGRVLHDWAVEQFPGKHIPEPKTIQAHIRDDWHRVHRNAN